jgi:hypothetical protein
MKKTSVRPAKKTKTNASPRGGARPKSAGAEEGAEPMLDEPAKKPTKKPATSGPKRPAKKAARPAAKTVKRESELPDEPVPAGSLSVRRMHRRDLNRVWEFLKLVFRDVNRGDRRVPAPPQQAALLGELRRRGHRAAPLRGR